MPLAQSGELEFSFFPIPDGKRLAAISALEAGLEYCGDLLFGELLVAAVEAEGCGD